jgi:predicted metal-dependent hydrolase
MLISGEMQQEGLFADFASALLFETPAEIYARVFRELRPRTPPPAVDVKYCRYASVHSSIRMEKGRVFVRISDILEGAPAPVTEALAFILIGKMLRKPIARGYSHRYRLYLNRKDVRRQTHLVRQSRGRKMLSHPQGRIHNLEEIFERLNAEYFDGLLGRPALGWSLRRSRSMLGHFDPSHNAIILSKIFDEPGTPAVAVEYVMFHEMLHLRYPVEHKGARRCVHTPEFKKAEKKYPRLKEAKEVLKKLR